MKTSLNDSWTKEGRMPKGKRKTKRETSLCRAEDSTPRGIILERFKRMKSDPNRSLDLISEFFIQHYLRTKRTFL
jgi:hypothetical protein